MPPLMPIDVGRHDRTKVVRKGRPAERIVALLEKALLPDGAEVKSPVFLADKITGELREVDIAIRFKLGAIPILVIIECRDRRAKADVLWIEQVAQKRQDLNAAKAIAVSTSGFSAPAYRKAEHHGIETRILARLTEADVDDWFAAGDLRLFDRRSEVKRVSVALDSRSVTGEFEIDPVTAQKLANLKLHDPLFNLKKTGESISTLIPWSHARNMPGVYDGVPQDGTRVQRIIELEYPDPSERYILRVAEGSAEVVAFRFYAELWIDERSIPVQQVLGYGSPQGDLVKGVQYEVPTGATTVLVTVHRRTDTGEMAVSFSRAEKIDKASRKSERTRRPTRGLKRTPEGAA